MNAVIDALARHRKAIQAACRENRVIPGRALARTPGCKIRRFCITLFFNDLSCQQRPVAAPFGLAGQHRGINARR
jgi:hypothetical protein